MIVQVYLRALTHPTSYYDIDTLETRSYPSAVSNSPRISNNDYNYYPYPYSAYYNVPNPYQLYEISKTPSESFSEKDKDIYYLLTS